MRKGPWAGQRQRSSMAWALHHPPGSPGSWWKEGAGSGARSRAFNWSKKQGQASLRSVPRSPLLSVSPDLSPGDPLWLASSKASGLCLRLLLPGPVVRKFPTLVKSTGGVAGCGFLSVLLHLLFPLVLSVSMVKRTQALFVLALGCEARGPPTALGPRHAAGGEVAIVGSAGPSQTTVHTFSWPSGVLFFLISR
ncbi:unnamed protein product [Rangifer tarandus platyrhynchus]|uniref:Uncharacterized protein n=2 Tax=Rangifer tarandus platyrhynchus TaxID=3082113 RepID=A0ABN8YNX3_RANTA|nr:unnamed protein product [Rangifer tarandus platyrhynchus]